MRFIILLTIATVAAASLAPPTVASARVWRVPGSGRVPPSFGNVGLTGGLAKHCIFVPDPHGARHQVCL
jgi:hypothetical protein